ncbi:MAG: tandem-95 repeat protein, partial [Gammaproteobacteria bacterium]
MDESSIAETRAAIGGVTYVPLSIVNLDFVDLVGVLPASAGPDDVMTIYTQATDSGGKSTGELEIEVPFVDGTDPEIAITDPAAETAFAQGDTLSLAVEYSDNFGVTNLAIRVSGAISLSEDPTVDAVPGSSEIGTFDLTIPGDAPQDGSVFTVSVTAEDAAGNRSVAATRTFTMVDTTPPSLVTVSPADASTNTPLWPYVEVEFDDLIDPVTVDNAAVGLIGPEGGVAGMATLIDGGTTIRFAPTAPLEPATNYTFSITSAVLGADGNALEPLTSTFTTTTASFASPDAGDKFVEGQELVVDLDLANGAGVQSVTFTLDGADFGSTTSASLAVTANTPAPADGDPAAEILATLQVVPAVAGLNPVPDSQPVAIDPLGVELYSADVDADNDGMLNGDEIANGLDPFRDDAVEDPDSDNLSNADELAGGTNPLNPDTDGDGIRDDIDSQPLVPNSGFTPVAGKSPQRNLALYFDGVDDHAWMSNGTAYNGNVSIELWFRNDDDFSSETSRNFLLTKVGSGDDLFIAYNSDHTVTFRARDGSGSAHDLTSAPLDAGWHHVAAVHDATNGQVLLYIDGVVEDSRSVPTGIRHTGTTWYLGAFTNPGQIERLFQGAIDQLRIYSIVRTQQQIKDTLFSSQGSGGGYRWNFDEGSGVVAYDETNGNAQIGGTGFDWRLGGPGFVNDAMPTWVAGAPGLRDQWVACALPESLTALSLEGFDRDGAFVTSTVTTLPENGRLFQTPDGVNSGAEITTVPTEVLDSQNRVLYEPNPGFVGADGLAYTVTDPFETSLPVTIPIYVDPRNQAPVAVDDNVIAFEDFENVLDLTANDSDPEGRTLQVVSVTGASNGTVAINPDGTVSYEPDPGFNGTDSFTYTIADEVAWIRFEDFDAGPGNNSLENNSSTGPFGFPVWSHDYIWKITSATDPLDLRASARMRWDTNMIWDSINRAMWTMHSDYPPGLVEEGLLIRSSGSYGTRSYVPVVRWISPCDDFDVDLVGSLLVDWPEGSSVTSVEILIGTIDAETGSGAELLRQTVNRSGAFETLIPVDLAGLNLNQGDAIVIMAEVDNSAEGTFIIEDRLAVIPSSATKTATVTLDVRQNSTPVLTPPGAGYGLAFIAGGGGFGGGGGGQSRPVGIEDALIDPSGSYSLSMWFESSVDFSTGATVRPLVVKGADRTVDFGLQYNSSEKVELTMVNNLGTTFTLESPALGDGWNHAIGVFDDAADQVRLYVNGRLVASAATTGTIRDSGNYFMMGNNRVFGGGGSQRFAGSIDEVSLWSRALTDADAVAIWQRRLDPPTETGLTGYWPMDEGTGSTAADATENGLDLGSLDFGGGSGLPWIPSEAPFENAVTALEDLFSLIVLPATDPDEEPLSGTVASLATLGTLFQTENGTTPESEITAVPAALSGGNLELLYLSPLNFSGFDRFDYTVSDGKVETPVGNLLVRVLPSNDQPLAANDPDAATTVEGVPVVTIDVLANDTDIDSADLTVSSFTDGGGGSVAYNGDGTFTYTPNFGFSGTDTFTYTASDGEAESDPATVSVNVTSLPGIAWINPAGGNWNDGANWDGGQVPGAGEKALIELDGDYTITVTTATQVGVVQMTASSGKQTLAVSANLTINDGGYLNEQSRYEQNTATLDAVGPVRFLGEVAIANAAWQGAGAKSFGPLATVSLGGFSFNGGDISNEGTVTVDYGPHGLRRYGAGSSGLEAVGIGDFTPQERHRLFPWKPIGPAVRRVR